MGPPRQVPAIAGQVLGHQVEFPHAGVRQPLGLDHQVGDGPGAERPPDGRNGAEVAAPGAAVGHPQVGPTRPAGQRPGVPGGKDPSRPGEGQAPRRRRGQQAGQAAGLARPHQEFDLRQAAGQLLAVATHQATDHHQPLSGPAVPGQGEDRVQGFLHRRTQETAGVDQEHGGRAGIGLRPPAGGQQLAGQMLPLHQVLGAPEVEEIEAASGFAPHARPSSRASRALANNRQAEQTPT